MITPRNQSVFFMYFQAYKHKNNANCNKANFCILYGYQNASIVSLTALVISFLKDTQIFTAQCEMNVYRSHLIPYDNMSYHDEGPLFPTSDRGDLVLIQDQNLSDLVSPFLRTIFAVCFP